MIPLGDDRRKHRTAVVTYTLMALCALVFAWQKLGAGSNPLAFLGFSFIPGMLFGGAELPSGLPGVPPPATLVSYMFLHGGWLHVAGNLLYLWVFFPTVEDSLGPGTSTVLFIGCGIAAALVQALPDPASSSAVIGASGGVSGVLGAYLVLHPRESVRLLVPVGLVLRVVRLPAFVVLLAWFALQLLYAEWTPQEGGGIAFRAHIGGFAAGMLFAPLLALITRQQSAAAS